MGRRLNAADVIRNTRNTKACWIISEPEFLYVVSHPDLTETEKLLWLIIAYYAEQDPNLTCTLDEQALGDMLRLDIVATQLALTRLALYGFLHQRKEDYSTFILTLPDEGLMALMAFE